MAAAGIDVMTDVIPALLLVVCAPIALWWFVRRSKGTTPHRLRISDKAAIGKGVWVAVVAVDGKRYLVGAGESGVGLISELGPLPDEAEEPAAEPDMNGLAEQPRIGLVRRLQLMTVRSSAPSPWRPFGASRK
jgi:flagellar biogenesis protein FliO